MGAHLPMRSFYFVVNFLEMALGCLGLASVLQGHNYG